MLSCESFKVSLFDKFLKLLYLIFILHLFRCSARIRTKHEAGQVDKLQIINLQHSHEIITGRRKYGSLKMISS